MKKRYPVPKKIYKPDPPPAAPIIEEIYEPAQVETWIPPAIIEPASAPQTVEDDPYADDLPDLDDTDPDCDITVRKMKKDLQSQASLMIPQMYEKFVNAGGKDAVAIFESVADRAELNKPDTNKGGGATMNNLILTSQDMVPLLEGLAKITGGSDDD